MSKSEYSYNARERKWFWGLFVVTVIAFGIDGAAINLPRHVESAVDYLFWGIIIGLSLGSNVRNIVRSLAKSPSDY